MTSKQMTPEEEFSALSKQNNILIILEYLSALSSIVGSIIAILTEQIAFAASPLTLSVALNLFNRTIADRLIKKSADIDLLETQRAFATSVQGLRSKFLNMDFSDDDEAVLSERSEMLQELSSKVKKLEAFLEIQGSDYYSQSGSLNQEIDILRNHQVEMAQAIETLTTQLDSNTEQAVNQDEVIDHLERLSAVVYDLEQKTAGLNPENFEGNVSEAHLESFKAELNTMIEPLQAQISGLEEQIRIARERKTPPSIDEKTVRSNIESFLSPLQSQVSSLEERVNAQSIASPDPQSFVDISQYEQVQQDVDVLSAKVDNSLTQLSSDIAGFQDAMQSTHVQMREIHERIESVQQLAHESSSTDIESLQAQIEAANAPLRAQYESIESKLNELNQLQARLTEVQAWAQNSAAAIEPEALQQHIEATNAPLREQVSALESRIQSEPENIQQEFRQSLEPLQAHVNALEARVSEVSSQDPETVVLHTIRPLQDQLQNLEARLNEIPTQQPDKTEQINLLHTQITEIQARLDAVSNQVSTDLNKLPELVEQKVETRMSLLQLSQSMQVDPDPVKNPKSQLDDLLETLDF